MKFIDKEKLPVEIKNNQMPKDEHKKYEFYYDEKIRTNGGFADACFLDGAMLTCFLWGMIIILVAR